MIVDHHVGVSVARVGRIPPFLLRVICYHWDANRCTPYKMRFRVEWRLQHNSMFLNVVHVANGEDAQAHAHAQEHGIEDASRFHDSTLAGESDAAFVLL